MKTATATAASQAHKVISDLFLLILFPFSILDVSHVDIVKPIVILSLEITYIFKGTVARDFLWDIFGLDGYARA